MELQVVVLEDIPLKNKDKNKNRFLSQKKKKDLSQNLINLV